MANIAAWTAGGARRTMDWLERLAILAFYGWLVVRLLAGYFETGNAANLILLVSEGTAVILILIRRHAGEISRRPADWLLAVFATVAPLLVDPHPEGALLQPEIGAFLMVCGIILQVSAKLALGRSFGCVAAHRGLIVRGPYRFVRHPIYMGYLVSHLAFVLMNPSVWNLGVYCFAYLMQVPRLLAEERLLRRDPQYQQYMKGVRYRLLPGVY